MPDQTRDIFFVLENQMRRRIGMAHQGIAVLGGPSVRMVDKRYRLQDGLGSPREMG